MSLVLYILGSTWFTRLYVSVTIRYVTVYQDIWFLEKLIIWQVFTCYAYAPQFYKRNFEFKGDFKLISQTGTKFHQSLKAVFMTCRSSLDKSGPIRVFLINEVCMLKYSMVICTEKLTDHTK